MENNICRFVPTKSIENMINIINFVYEKVAEFPQKYIIPSSYAIGVVTDGVGTLHTSMGEYELKENCVFIIFSAKPYFIENRDSLKYIYISFTGSRASGLLERINLSVTSPVKYECEEICIEWKKRFDEATDKNTDLVCESLLLGTIARLCKNEKETSYSKSSDGILHVKHYIDTHFTDCGLDLSSVGKMFSYSPKYLSSAFEKLVRVSFSKYLRDKRLEHSKMLISNGIESISELANMSGYSDPLYFSKSFKQKYGISPKKYITNQHSSE